MKVRFLILLTVLAVFLAGCNAYGGGWLESSTGEGKATFGFGINCTQIDAHNILLSGQVQYTDRPAEIQFHGEIEQPFTRSTSEISCDDPFAVNPPTLIGTYRMLPSGETGEFTWSATDYGEPGPSQGDRIVIRLYDGGAFHSLPFYVHGGVIGGGNVQVLP